MACMYFRERNLILRALRLFLYTTIQKYNRAESIPGKYIVAFEVGPSTDNIHYGHKQWAKHFSALEALYLFMLG